MPNALTNTSLFECSHLRQSLYGKKSIKYATKEYWWFSLKKDYIPDPSLALVHDRDREGKKRKIKNIYIKQGVEKERFLD